MIDSQGNVHWSGRKYRSLSEVARAIAIVRFSGAQLYAQKRGFGE